jgi:hypothetical protein
MYPKYIRDSCPKDDVYELDYAVYIPAPSRINLECFIKGLCTKFKVPFASDLQRVLLNKEHIADWRPTRLICI